MMDEIILQETGESWGVCICCFMRPHRPGPYDNGYIEP